MRKLNILVVDDDADNAESLAELFSLYGHDVSVAYNGAEAVAAFNHTAFDMGFFDVMMPGQNGVDCFIEIRNRRPDANVYFMTGYSASDLLDKAVAHGALGVFSKPIDLENMLSAIALAANQNTQVSHVH
jgi:DNA-binding NtrC family response regulator